MFRVFILFLLALIPSATRSSESVLEMVGRLCDGIDPSVVLSMIKVESDFNHKAVTYDTEPNIGLMQIKKSTARFVGCLKSKDSLYHPETNIKCGCGYLKFQLDRYDRKYSYAVAAYNAGRVSYCRTGTLTSGRQCEIGKLVNQDYVDKVFKGRSHWKKM